MSKVIIGVMGPGESATPEVLSAAEELGELIANEGWIVLTGGRSSGVMEAALKGAKQNNGLTVGVLPAPGNVSEHVDIKIQTGMGSGRNVINVLSSNVVIACGIGAGTASEVALAIKENIPVVLLSRDNTVLDFFRKLNPDIKQVGSPTEVIKNIKSYIFER